MSLEHIAESRIQQYLDNKSRGLTENEKEHLQSCSHCQATVADYQRIYGELARESRELLSPGFAARTMARIRQQVQPSASYGRATMLLGAFGVLSCFVAIYYLFDIKALLQAVMAFSLGDTIANSSLATSFGHLSTRLGDSLPILIFAALILVAVALVDRLLVRQKTSRVYFLSV